MRILSTHMLMIVICSMAKASSINIVGELHLTGSIKIKTDEIIFSFSVVAVLPYLPASSANWISLQVFSCFPQFFV